MDSEEVSDQESILSDDERAERENKGMSAAAFMDAEEDQDMRDQDNANQNQDNMMQDEPEEESKAVPASAPSGISDAQISQTTLKRGGRVEREKES